MMYPLRHLAVGLLALSVLASSALAAQPTFGRPKPDKKQKQKPEPPAQVDPGSGDAPSDIPDAARPDTPDDRSPMFEPDPSRPEFVPSPEEWLDTDPPRQKPSSDLTPGETYAWRSAEGLRFTYTIPANYKPGEGYDVVVICHPHNSDFRWGLANHLSLSAAKDRGSERLAFRPNNIIVSVDGIGADPNRPKLRDFPCDDASAVRFRDFMLELTRILPARRFYLYGAGGGDDEHGGSGGQFVMQFASTFPALADGVIAYGANPAPGEVRRTGVPIVLVHGVKNGLVPFREAVSLLASHVQAENKLVRLRALRAFNDYPNPFRVAECIDWLDAVRTDDAKEALADVERMLTPKVADEYDYLCPVWYSGAREILGRILAEPGPLTGEAPLEGRSAAPPEVRGRADEIVKLLDAEAQTHIAALRAFIPEGTKVADLVLDGQPWLGHLIAARDDFRNIAPMETFAADIGYDEALAAHREAAAEFIADWTTRDDAENFTMAGELLPQCFLVEELPVDLSMRMKSWKKKHQSGELEVSAEALEAYENVLNWDEGYRKGLDAYQKIWRKWRFEPARQAQATEPKR